MKICLSNYDQTGCRTAQALCRWRTSDQPAGPSRARRGYTDSWLPLKVHQAPGLDPWGHRKQSVNGNHISQENPMKNLILEGFRGPWNLNISKIRYQNTGSQGITTQKHGLISYLAVVFLIQSSHSMPPQKGICTIWEKLYELGKFLVLIKKKK